MVEWDAPPREALGMVALQAIPGAMGALLARRQLSGDGGGEGDEDQASYFGELFLMAVGALFFALNTIRCSRTIDTAIRARVWIGVAL